MGWTHTHRGSESIEAYFKHAFDYDHSSSGGGTGKVLDCAVVNLRTAYMAYEITKPGEPRRVVALVCLLKYAPHDYHNFGYKDMDESCGPCEIDCPERIFKQLTPLTEDEGESSSRKWRDRVWQNIQAKKKRPRLTDGVIIKTKSPIGFMNGAEGQIFKVYKPKGCRRTRFHMMYETGHGLRQYYGLFRIPKRLLADAALYTEA